MFDTIIDFNEVDTMIYLPEKMICRGKFYFKGKQIFRSTEIEVKQLFCYVTFQL